DARRHEVGDVPDEGSGDGRPRDRRGRVRDQPAGLEHRVPRRARQPHPGQGGPDGEARGAESGHDRGPLNAGTKKGADLSVRALFSMTDGRYLLAFWRAWPLSSLALPSTCICSLSITAPTRFYTLPATSSTVPLTRSLAFAFSWRAWPLSSLALPSTSICSLPIARP